MKKRSRILLGGLVIVVVAMLAWLFVIPHEPRYQGRSLTEWLEEYHQAGSMKKAARVDEAIRAMGTNSLPYLVKYIRAGESPMMRKLSGLLQKQSIVKISNYEPDRYANPSILAVRALGADAASIVLELWPDYFQDAISLYNQSGNTGDAGVYAIEFLGLHAVPELMKLYPMVSDIEKDIVVEMLLRLRVEDFYSQRFLTPSVVWHQTPDGNYLLLILSAIVHRSGDMIPSVTAIWSRVSDPDLQFKLLEKLERTIDRAEGHLDSIPEFEDEQLLQLLKEAANGGDPRVSGVATRILQKLNAEIANPVMSLEGQE